MKKTILFVAVLFAISFASCEKERECTCTTTSSFAGSSSTNTETITYKDVSKSKAKTLCSSWTSTDSKGVVTTKDCSLK
ncbi:MAG: hypothetical protein H0W84_06660 [Bacteroidetes bacterium]|nr:hypothetical protein [Bacteroidota bacterium]